MSEDAAPGKKLYYATAVSAGEMTLEELCEDIAESSTVTSADVKAVLDRLGWVLSKNLKAGRIVQVGELGNFRMTLGSSGTPTIEEFNASLAHPQAESGVLSRKTPPGNPIFGYV